MALEEVRYHQLADHTLNYLLKELDQFDPDEVEAFLSMGVLKVTFADKSVCVINSHAAARQIWMAADNTAWHFSYDEKSSRWLCTRTGGELFGLVSELLSKKMGTPIAIKAG